MGWSMINCCVTSCSMKFDDDVDGRSGPRVTFPSDDGLTAWSPWSHIIGPAGQPQADDGSLGFVGFERNASAKPFDTPLDSPQANSAGVLQGGLPPTAKKARKRVCRDSRRLQEAPTSGVSNQGKLVRSSSVSMLDIPGRNW